MTDPDIRIATFEASTLSVRAVRAFVDDLLSGWSLEDLRADASLCAAELAANAVLHSREPFTVVVSPMTEGIRIEVIDRRPDLLPYSIPTTGSAADLTALGGIGRGLMLVAAIASRWGTSTTPDSKDVWVEVNAKGTNTVSPPVLLLRHHEPPLGEVARITCINLPVRAAIASGIQVEEILREAQLDPIFLSSLNEGGSDVFDLIDRSAPVRLAGWHAALQASAAEATRFDLRLSAAVEALVATAALRAVLSGFALRSPHRVALVTPAVAAFRSWLDAEMERQRQGQPPSPCPLES